MKKLIYVTLLFLAASCAITSEKELGINDSFELILENCDTSFTSYNFLVRSSSYDGSKGIFYSYYYNAGKSGPVVLHMSPSCELDEIKYHLFSDSLRMTEVQLKKRTIDFCKMNIAKLRSDSVGNLYLSFTSNEKLDYAYLRDSVNKEQKYNYVSIGNGWYSIK
jgi:hypothetical protein